MIDNYAGIAAEVATITVAHSGATYDLAALHPVEQGVAVAVAGCERVVPVADEAEITAAIAGYLATYAADFADGAALGTWIHGDLLYLDVVRVTDVEEAEVVAAALGELAIFDLTAGAELPIPTSALRVA